MSSVSVCVKRMDRILDLEELQRHLRGNVFLCFDFNRNRSFISSLRDVLDLHNCTILSLPGHGLSQLAGGWGGAERSLSTSIQNHHLTAMSLLQAFPPRLRKVVLTHRYRIRV